MSLLRGRFDSELDDLMKVFSSSLNLDLEMAVQDVDGSLAHAAMLGATGIISPEEAEALKKGLEQIRGDLRSGDWTPDDEEEDIHMAVEARLVELEGEVGKKLHTARSRNDQVATTVRLWMRERLHELDAAAQELISVLLARIESHGQVLMPGYTHLQRGQPILLGHHLLAHAYALSRDRERFADSRLRVDRCPLGACAMAGTALPIDRQMTARQLAFPSVMANAMDAVSARDHIQETVAACAICMAHLSRVAAEIVLWSSAEMDFVRLEEGHSTGSSIMPQKRNPDAAELVRGKAGGVFADVQTLLTLVKGLPLSYQRDLQEDRAPLLHATTQTLMCLRVTAALWESLTVKTDRFEKELEGDFLLATEIADLLVEKGVPFREAHELVGRMVRWCEEQGGNLTLLNGGLARRWHPSLPHDLGPWLDPRAAAERRTSQGGTAWSEVTRQVELLRSTLG